MRGALREILRLYPTATFVTRILDVDAEFGNFIIPKGQIELARRKFILILLVFYFQFSIFHPNPQIQTLLFSSTLILYSYRVQVVLWHHQCTQQVDVQRIILTHYAFGPTDGCGTIAKLTRWCWSLKCLSHSPSVLARVSDERSQRLKSPVWCRKWVN